MQFNSERQPAKQWQIVVVDDDPLVLRVHSEMLRLMGHSTISFECPKKALQYLEANGENVDLLITDYRMPEIDGLNLIERLRQSGNRFPSMILTAYIKDVDVERADACQAKVVSKPLPLQVLASHISAFQAG